MQIAAKNASFAEESERAVKVTAKPGKAVSQTFRLDDLMQMAREEGRIVAEDAARRLGVTVQTIRRDLLTLAERGKLTRVHGGAVRP